jgi:hypothetical protein
VDKLFPLQSANYLLNTVNVLSMSRIGSFILYVKAWRNNKEFQIATLIPAGGSYFLWNVPKKPDQPWQH